MELFKRIRRFGYAFTFEIARNYIEVGIHKGVNLSIFKTILLGFCRYVHRFLGIASTTASSTIGRIASVAKLVGAAVFSGGYGYGMVLVGGELFTGNIRSYWQCWRKSRYGRC